jgi:hypothetical protein
MDTRLAWRANWNNIMNDKTIVCREFNSDSQRWDPNCRRERDATFWKDLGEYFFLQFGNDRQCTREVTKGSKSTIDLTWSSLLESPLGVRKLATDHEERFSDHRVIIWERRRDPTMNTLPSKVEERIHWDISRMSEDDNDEAECDNPYVTYIIFIT